MKLLLNLTLLVTALAALPAVNAAAQQQVEIRTTLIALPEADVVPKMLRGDFANDEALFDYAKARVAEGKARIEAAPRIVSPGGRRAKFENSKEIATPDHFAFTDTEPRKIVLLDYDWGSYGTELEVDPNILADGRVSLSMSFEHHLERPSMFKYTASLLQSAEESDRFVEQPIFYYEKVSLALQTPAGGTRLAAATRPIEPRDGVQECHLLFVRCNTKPEPAKAGKPERQMTLHFVAIEAPAATIYKETLLRGNRTIAEDTALLNRMLGLVELGNAAIAGHSLIKSTSGQRVKAEILRANLYPTEYHPVEPDLALPTSFEMRPTGTFLEAEPTLEFREAGWGDNANGDAVISLNIAPEIVGPMSLHPQRFALLDQGKTGSVVQPQFDSARITTSCELAANAGVALLGSIPSRTPGKQQLWFVRGDSEGAIPKDKGKRSKSRFGPNGIDTAVTAFAIPVREAAALLMTRPPNDANLFASLTERLEAGTASVVAHASVLTPSGQRAKVESNTEVIGPTEFEFFGKSGAIAGPTAFETRNTGFTLEVDPGLFAEGKMVSATFAIDLSLAPPEFGLAPVDTRDANLAVDGRHDHLLKLTTTFQSPVGEPVLAATIHPTGEAAIRAGVPKDTTILVFVRSSLRKP